MDTGMIIDTLILGSIFLFLGVSTHIIKNLGSKNYQNSSSKE